MPARDYRQTGWHCVWHTAPEHRTCGGVAQVEAESLPTPRSRRTMSVSSMAPVRSNGTEGPACTDRLQLLMISDQHEFGATRFDLPDEAAKLPAADHAGLVDDENIPVAERMFRSP